MPQDHQNFSRYSFYTTLLMWHFAILFWWRKGGINRHYIIVWHLVDMIIYDTLLNWITPIRFSIHKRCITCINVMPSDISESLNVFTKLLHKLIKLPFLTLTKPVSILNQQKRMMDRLYEYFHPINNQSFLKKIQTYTSILHIIDSNYTMCT